MNVARDVSPRHIAASRQYSKQWSIYCVRNNLVNSITELGRSSHSIDLLTVVDILSVALESSHVGVVMIEISVTTEAFLKMDALANNKDSM
jgi:hypothetical protein